MGTSSRVPVMPVTPSPPAAIFAAPPVMVTVMALALLAHVGAFDDELLELGPRRAAGDRRRVDHHGRGEVEQRGLRWDVGQVQAEGLAVEVGGVPALPAG